VLVYLHGLNSSGRSHKVGVLRRALAPRPVLAPDYPAHDPTAAVAILVAWFARLPTPPAGDPGLILVGSSMGGFYGQYLARRLHVAHLYLINPALTPWDLFPPYLGETMTTAQGEDYTVTVELIEATRPFGIADPCDGVPTSLFLDAGDEVIDPAIALRIYRDCGDVRLFPDGDHAFSHLDALVTSIQEFLGRPVLPQPPSNLVRIGFLVGVTEAARALSLRWIPSSWPE
jgi:predicted esterase YcpF (UPF0227 family)